MITKKEDLTGLGIAITAREKGRRKKIKSLEEIYTPPKQEPP
ncbi:MAG: hypothetical protein AAFQ91_15015 [Cyanobacteria bacterium J06621_15]